MRKKYEEVVREYQKTNSQTDKDGSYTGFYEPNAYNGKKKDEDIIIGNKLSKPVQDADDL